MERSEKAPGFREDDSAASEFRIQSACYGILVKLLKIKQASVGGDRNG
jgi:hypothetical protein